LIDPGPGSIVRCASSRPKLDPSTLDAIILTHRHLDHCNDINVMIEAMTEGGFKKRGVVFCPADALSPDPVILKYLHGFPQEIRLLEPQKNYSVGNFEFETSMEHIHPVQTYGIKFSLGGKTVSILSDTRYFKNLETFYASDVLILFVVLVEPRPGIDHMSLKEAVELIRTLRPQKTILTHFGMRMLTAKPHILARQIADESGLEVVAAADGMTFEFS
jgi:phosphoribosyl 1,2-cyclic phosphodiesterase